MREECVPPSTASWLRRRLRRSGFDVDRRDAARLLSESDGFAEPFLRLLGAEDVVSVDARRASGAPPGDLLEIGPGAGFSYRGGRCRRLALRAAIRSAPGRAGIHRV